MKISRDARKRAKKLYRFCAPEGHLDENRIRQVITQLIAEKPRHYLGMIGHLRKLLGFEVAGRTVQIHAAQELSDGGIAIFSELERLYGPALKKVYVTDPGLIGGLRIQRGSDVWDGSVKDRLQRLEQSLN
jgi:F-type H+-transporting ATPase subunit delta